jgi:hypothetical protein
MSEGNGASLYAVNHPVGEIEVTEEMLAAGNAAFVEHTKANGVSNRVTMLAAIYRAMAEQAPVYDLDEDSLVEAEIEVPDSPEVKHLKKLLDEAQGWLGGFMGSMTAHLKVEALRTEIRNVLGL